MKFDTRVFFQNISRNFKSSLKYYKSKDNSHEKKLYIKPKHTIYVPKLSLENRALYEIMWKKIGQSQRGQKLRYNVAHALCVLDK